jgi:hypothetical protein
MAERHVEIYSCFISAIMKGRLCFANGSAEEILSQVIVPATKLLDECQECCGAVPLFSHGFQVRHYLIDGINRLCCMRLNAICTNSPRFSRDKHCLEHCDACPGRGACIYIYIYMYIYMNMNIYIYICV